MQSICLNPNGIKLEQNKTKQKRSVKHSKKKNPSSDSFNGELYLKFIKQIFLKSLFQKIKED